MDLQDKRVAILAADQYEDLELGNSGQLPVTADTRPLTAGH